MKTRRTQGPSLPNPIGERLLFPAKLHFAPTPPSLRDLRAKRHPALAFLVLTSAFILLTSTFSKSCGLDWTLPTNHFDGVNERGYVSYWKKIGQADLGDGLVIPLNINFCSGRETSSPTLGKGWMLALLESHVEPIDENTMKVIMPDGWNFYFLRKGGSQDWGGNAGWAGQTDGARFTITAPCGWRVKFDTGRIQEIDTPKNRTITIKYNGPAATEADIDNTPFVQIDPNPATGVAQDIVVGGQKIAITQAQRPRIQSVMGKTLLTGFDPALSQLQYPNGKNETFDAAPPQSLTPTLAISKSDQPQRNLTWDPTTKQIKTDGEWTYHLTPSDNITLDRTNAKGQIESYFSDPSTGTTITEGIDGIREITRTFASGTLKGRIRSVTIVKNKVSTVVRKFDYNESGKIIREILGGAKPKEIAFKYDSLGREVEIDLKGQIAVKEEYDKEGRLVCKTFNNGIKETYAYFEHKIEQTTYLKNGKTLVARLPGAVAGIVQNEVSTGNISPNVITKKGEVQ